MQEGQTQDVAVVKISNGVRKGSREGPRARLYADRTGAGTSNGDLDLVLRVG